MRLILFLIITSVSVLLSARILPGVHIVGLEAALFVSLALWLLNLLVRPLLILLTLPFTIATFGLFILIINAVIVLAAEQVIHGFSIDNFWWALLFSLVLAIIRGIMERLLGTGRPEGRNY